MPIITQNCTVFSVSPAIKVANGETVEINSKNIGILTNQQEIIYKEHTNSILQFYKFLRNYREGKETRGVMKIYDLTHKNKSDNLIPNIEPYNDNIFSVGGLASYQFKKNKEQAPDKVFEELEALNPESKNVFSVQVQKLFELSDKNLNICKTRG